MNNNTSVRQSILPSPQYVDLKYPDGWTACRFDPRRGVLEFQRKGVKHYFDLTQLVKPVDINCDSCYDNAQ